MKVSKLVNLTKLLLKKTKAGGLGKESEPSLIKTTMAKGSRISLESSLKTSRPCQLKTRAKALTELIDQRKDVLN